MRTCKDPARWCYKHDGLCCKDCREWLVCTKNCTWKGNCFLSEEKTQDKRTLEGGLVDGQI